MSILTRTELVEKVRKLAGLSQGKETLGYFTRQQLLELVVRLESDDWQERDSARKELTADADKETDKS
jgi:hypothetical protein